MKKIILSTLIFAAISIFIYKNTVIAQSSCAVINSISTNVTEVEPKKLLNCDVTVDQAFAGSPSIACGVSFNGAWPQDYCPSDQFFGGWQGNNAKFNCVFPSTNVPETITKVELVAFDFRPECGPQTGKTVPLTLKKDSSDTTPFSESANQYIRDLLTAILGGVNSGEDSNPEPQPESPEPDPVNPTSAQNPPPDQTIVSLEDFFDTTNISYPENLNNMISKCLSFRSTYEQAGRQTGVPWQVLAGIHFREGSCGSGVSLVSGRPIGGLEPDVPRGACSSQQQGPGIPIPVAGGCGFPTFLDTAIYAGNHLKGKIGKTPQTFAELTMALSRYNGGGNSNCGKTPYRSCPKLHYGEDDTYVMNLFDARHTPMYIVYCADYTLCNPAVKDSRPGTATAARIAAGLTQ